MRKDCDLCGVTSLLTSEPHLKELADGLRRKRSARVYGLPSAAHVATTAVFARALDAPVLLVTAYPDRALQLVDELPSWLGARHEAHYFPALDALHIDLTDGELRPSTTKDRIRVNNRIEESLKVSRLDVRGQPMLLRNARLNMSLIASGAQLAFERDRKGRPVMMLAEARSGMLAIDVTQADLESLLLQNARDAASKYGITVEKTRLKFTPQTPRSIQASLYGATKIGFVPAGMHFKAHMTIDNAMNARITGLTCDGDDVLGPIIVGLLRPALANYNGRTRPLLSFPAGKLQLRDVGLRVDDALHLTANFGS